MHKSALLRYFETREEIFLRLTADDWQRVVRRRCAPNSAPWSSPAPGRHRSRVRTTRSPIVAASATFLAQAPLNLERNVSVEAVRRFKLVTHTEVDAIVTVICTLEPTLSQADAIDVIAATTSMAGALWQMATPGPEVAALYRSDPRLSHAVFDVEARLGRLTAAILRGLLALGVSAERTHGLTPYTKRYLAKIPIAGVNSSGPAPGLVTPPS